MGSDRLGFEARKTAAVSGLQRVGVERFRNRAFGETMNVQDQNAIEILLDRREVVRPLAALCILRRKRERSSASVAPGIPVTDRSHPPTVAQHSLENPARRTI